MANYDIEKIKLPSNDIANLRDSTASHATNWENGSATGSVRTSGSTTESSSYTIGQYAVAEGQTTVASGSASHASGTGTTAQRKSQTTIGEYNVLDTAGADGTVRGSYAFIIGNGTSSTRSNALTVDWSGNLAAQGSLTSGSWTWDSSQSNHFTLYYE